MNIKFNKLNIKNFMSFTDVSLDLTDLGLCFVSGINLFDKHADSNGSGKSSLTSESILWCLTGETSNNNKDLNNNLVPNSIAEVSVEFELDNHIYIVERINTNNKTLKIIKDGVDISGNTYTKSKEILDNELGFLNKNIISSIIILSQGLTGRFSSLLPSERKSRLEYIVGLDSLLDKLTKSLSNAEQKINDSITDINLKIAEQKVIIQTNQDIINSNTINSDITEEEYKNYINEYNSSVQQYNDIRINITKEKQKEQKLIYSLKTLNDSIIEQTNKKNLLETKKNDFLHKATNLNNQLEKIKEQKAVAEKAECPLCHQHLPNNDLIEQLQQEINTLENNKNQITAEYKQSNIEKELVDIDSTITKLNSEKSLLEQEKDNINTAIKEYNTNATNIYNNLSDIDSKIKLYKNMQSKNEAINDIIEKSTVNIENAKQVIEKLNEELTKYNKDKDIYKYFKNSASKKFRNFLLEGVISYLNRLLEKYSTELFDGYSIYLENNGNDIDIRCGKKYLGGLSGGEKRKVDLAIQFALRNLARNQTNFTSSLLVLDEVLDGLDSTGIEYTMKFIENEIKDVDTVFFTTHKNDITINYDSILTITKDINEFSKVEVSKNV